MNLHRINESFKDAFEHVIQESHEPSQIEDLRKALDDQALRLSMSGTMNLKEYEIAFQDAIERVFPDKSWWEVTDCNIFGTLFETRDITETIECILRELKPEAIEE